MEYYSAIKRNDWYMQQLGWISRELCWIKCKNLTATGYILHDSIYIASFNDKIIEINKRLLFATGKGGGW